MSNERYAKQDEQLFYHIKQLQAGYKESYNEIYDLSSKYIYKIIYDIVQDYHTTEDMLQETYLKIYNNIGSLQCPETFYVWAGRIATNLCIRYTHKYRKEQLQSAMDDGEGNEQFIFDTVANDNEAFIPESVMDNKEHQRLIGEVIDALSVEQKLAVQCFYFEEMSVKEIAQAMECSEGTIKSRLNYARKSIKEAVLRIEKTQGTKLYSLGAIPILLVAYRGFAEMTIASASASAAVASVVVPTTTEAAATVGATTVATDVVAGATGAAGTTTIGGTVAGASAVATATGAAGAAVAGISGKIAAFIVAGALVTGGIIGGSHVINNIKNEQSTKEDAAMEKKEQAWFDIAFATMDIETKYDFEGDAESKLQNYEEMSKELNKLFDDMVDKGKLKSYEQGALTYYLHIEDGLTYLYSAPFVLDDFLVGGSFNIFSDSLLGDASNISGTIKDDSKGQILVIDSISNQMMSTNVLENSISEIYRSDLNYEMTYFDENKCNSMDSLYEMLTSWHQYDVILWEGLGDSPLNSSKSSTICVANNVPIESYEEFVKEHPEFDFRSKDCLPGLVVGVSQYEYITTDASDLQKEHNHNYKTVKTITIAIDASTIDALYKDASLKNTIMYIASSFCGQNDVWSNILFKKGARALIAYDNLVSVKYHADMVQDIFPDMVMFDNETKQQNTLEAAVETAKKECGESDGAYKDYVYVEKLLGDGDKENNIVVFAKDGEQVRLPDYNVESSVGGDASDDTDTPDGDDGQGEEGGNTNNKESVLVGINTSSTKYDSDFKKIKANNKYLTAEQLSAENDIYQKVLKNLKEEDAEYMEDALTAAMNLFYVVACDNGHMSSYSGSVNNEKYVGLGMNYMTRILSDYALHGSIGYYSCIYIEGHFNTPRKAMREFMDAMNKRMDDPAEYTVAEQDALELCKMYIGIFSNHNQNVEKVAEAIVNYASSYSSTDSNRGLLKNNKEKYEKNALLYVQTLKEFNDFFK